MGGSGIKPEPLSPRNQPGLTNSIRGGSILKTSMGWEKRQTTWAWCTLLPSFSCRKLDFPKPCCFPGLQVWFNAMYFKTKFSFPVLVFWFGPKSKLFVHSHDTRHGNGGTRMFILGVIWYIGQILYCFRMGNKTHGVDCFQINSLPQRRVWGGWILRLRYVWGHLGGLVH